jgi:preprotein translocase subunit SecY
LPEVQSPTEDVPFRRKLVYTAGSLVVFFAGSQLRLYGVDTTMAADDPLFWAHTAYAGNFGTVMSLGVFPLVVLEMATHILLGLRAVNPTVENSIIL